MAADLNWKQCAPCRVTHDISRPYKKQNCVSLKKMKENTKIVGYSCSVELVQSYATEITQFCIVPVFIPNSNSKLILLKKK
jgi:hypothetical protein